MITFRIGARGSRLSLAQSRDTLDRISARLPGVNFELKAIETRGDVDQKRDLEKDFPEDFFTDTLDKATLNGEIDGAMHSAKDLPDEIRPELDWFWMPWHEDPRDVIILPKGAQPLSDKPRVGISSASRRAFAEKRWPGCEALSIRGNIDGRIEKLDRGEYDVIILAAAGLHRLGFRDRISEYIPLEELQTHPAQGYIALTFARDNAEMIKLRQLLTHPVVIAGSGTGSDGHYSVATRDALNASTHCLHDALMEQDILDHCGGTHEYVGKRAGEGGGRERQEHIIKRMTDLARKGGRVVRLKGGDPAMFGRLSDEIHALNREQIPFQIMPGIPWLCSAPLMHGIFLTERKSIRHFHVATGTTDEGTALDCTSLSSDKAPIYFFMASQKLEELSSKLIGHGYPKDTPIAVMRGKRGQDHILRSRLESVAKDFETSHLESPALVLVGDAAAADAAFSWQRGPLDGCRVLCPGSAAFQTKVMPLLQELGAETIGCEVFELQAMQEDELSYLDDIGSYDWVTLSSASAAEFFLQGLKIRKVDLRQLPKIAVSGHAAAEVLEASGVFIDHMPETFTSHDLGESFKSMDIKGKKFLIPRSDASVNKLGDQLGEQGADVRIEKLYRNISKSIDELPEFDAVLIGSPSALSPLADKFSDRLKAGVLGSIGPVTGKAIDAAGLTAAFTAQVHDAEHLCYALAAHWTWNRNPA